MASSETFTILSTNAPLVEVSGDGPIADLPGGLVVPDGAAITAPVSLLNAPVRRWRVDAPPTVPTSVVITDSPFGAFVGVRRCVASVQPLRWRRFYVSAWRYVRALLKRRAPSVLALWHLATDDAPPCRWRDVTNGGSNQASARGGDLVIATFVSP